MADNLSSASIVEELRTKTEQSDMSQSLKSTFGGYSKASVHEYLSVIRRQQQVMSETFAKNQQILFEEKEKLRKENEDLKRSLDTAVAEYNGLKSSLKLNELEDGEGKVLDLPTYRNRITVFEEELQKLETEKNLLSNQLAQKNKSLDDLNTKVEAFEEEKRAVREMLRAEMLESKNQRTLVAKLNETIEERDAEIAALHVLVSESEILKQNETIGRLNELLTEQNELIAKYTEEKEANLRAIFALGDENDSLRSNIARQKESADEFAQQNEKLSFTAKTLTEQLETEYKKTLELIKEKSALAIEKMSVSRRLEEANSKMALLEQKLRKLQSGDQPNENPDRLIFAAGTLKSAESK